MKEKAKKLKKVETPNLFRNSKKDPSSFRMIDLFAGIGGIRLGFEAHGGKTVFSSEWDNHAQKTYQANFDEIPYGDITKISPREIPEFDILLAGFPCQPFSQAGLKKGLADTRGTLFFDIAKIIDHHRPKAVFLENVKRFKTHDGGRTFEIIKHVLGSMGYIVHAEIFNARDFGVPQNRERIYIVALRGETDFSFPAPPKIPTKLGDILEKNPHHRYTISDTLWSGHQRRKLAHEANGYGFGYMLFNHNSQYTSTISARYYKDGSEILVKQRNKNPRKLTPREAARLQGFPEDFVIPVSDAQAYKQFGNSVAVPVIKAIAANVVVAMNQVPTTPSSRKTSIDLDTVRKDSVTEAKKVLQSAF